MRYSHYYNVATFLAEPGPRDLRKRAVHGSEALTTAHTHTLARIRAVYTQGPSTR